jgi:hypothetical protein
MPIKPSSESGRAASETTGRPFDRLIGVVGLAAEIRRRSETTDNAQKARGTEQIRRDAQTKEST